MQVRFVCAAAPAHPLHQLGSHADARRPARAPPPGGARLRRAAQPQRRLAQRDSAGPCRTRRPRSARRCMGLGFAWYPEENIREELASGRSRRCRSPRAASASSTLYLIYADPEAAGPGARRLAQILRDRVAESCRSRGEAPINLDFADASRTAARSQAPGAGDPAPVAAIGVPPAGPRRLHAPVRRRPHSLDADVSRRRAVGRRDAPAARPARVPGAGQPRRCTPRRALCVRRERRRSACASPADATRRGPDAGRTAAAGARHSRPSTSLTGPNPHAHLRCRPSRPAQTFQFPESA